MAHFLQASKSDLTRIFFTALLLVTISFGFFKQTKTFLHSQGDYFKPHPEPGERTKILKAELERKFFAVQIEKMRLGYFLEPKNRPRPAQEYLYDAQYGIAPYHFVFQDKKAEVIVAE